MENNQNNEGQGHGNFVATRVARPRDVANQGVETFFDRRFAQIRAQHGAGGFGVVPAGAGLGAVAGVVPAGAGLGAGGAGVFPAGAGLGAGAGVVPAGAGLGAVAGVVPAGAGLGAGGAGGVHAPLNNDRPTTPPQQPTRLTYDNHGINTPPPRQAVIPQPQVAVHQPATNQVHLVNGIDTPPPLPRGI